MVQNFCISGSAKGALAIFVGLVLLSCGADDRSITGLAQKGDLTRMRSLLDRGADANAKDDAD